MVNGSTKPRTVAISIPAGLEKERIKRERDRETDRETERQTDRQTETEERLWPHEIKLKS